MSKRGLKIAVNSDHGGNGASVPDRETVSIAMPLVRHFGVIDGLRGVAAILVLLYHITLYVQPPIGKAAIDLFFNHCYLAVDGFFVISGFVIAHAFDKRIAAGMSFKTFMALRIARLYPMIFLGLGLGSVILAMLWFQNREVPVWRFLVAFASNAVLLPTWTLSQLKEYVFPTNSAYWSLSFEMVVYAAFFVSFKWLKGKWIFAALTVSAIALYLVPTRGNSLNVGFFNYSYFGGFARVSYAFLAGMVIRRYAPLNLLPRNLCYLSIPFIIIILLNPLPQSRLYDFVAMTLGMPLIIWLAAQPGRAPTTDKVLNILGEASYPLYAIHFPLVLGVSRVLAFIGGGVAVQLAGSLTFVIGMVTVAYILNRIYDLPARQFLTRILGVEKKTA